MTDAAGLLSRYRNITVVGLSTDRERHSYQVAEYLQRHGYRIIPVNPEEDEVLGERSYPDLASAPTPVEIVNVFRRPEYALEVAEAAIAAGAQVIWYQPGTYSPDAIARAEAAGLEVVNGRCIRTVHRTAVA